LIYGLMFSIVVEDAPSNDGGCLFNGEDGINLITARYMDLDIWKYPD